MLRAILVIAIILTGLYYSLHGPFYLLLFYLWNAYFRPETWLWEDFISQLRLSFLLGIGLAVAVLFNLHRVRWTPRFVLVLLFFLQTLVSLYASEHPDWSWRYWVEFSKVLIVCVAITVLVTDLSRYRQTLLIIGYSLGFEAAKQGWAQMLLNPGGQNNNPHPIFGDNNGMGLGMMMLIPLFLALAETTSRRWEKLLHLFFTVGLFYRGISTYSRGAFLAAVVLGMVVFSRSRKKVRAVIGVAALCLLVFTVMPERFWQRMDTIDASAEDRDASQQGRLYFWRVAVIMADSKPLTGVGFNAYRPSFASYDPSAGTLFGEGRAVHSAWFGVLAEMGYPGFILFVALLVTTLVSCRRTRRGTSTLDPLDAQKVGAYAKALETSLIVFSVGVTFLNGHYNEMYWHLVGMSIALSWVLTGLVEPVTPKAQSGLTLASALERSA